MFTAFPVWGGVCGLKVKKVEPSQECEFEIKITFFNCHDNAKIDCLLKIISRFLKSRSLRNAVYYLQLATCSITLVQWGLSDKMNTDIIVVAQKLSFFY